MYRTAPEDVYGCRDDGEGDDDGDGVGVQAHQVHGAQLSGIKLVCSVYLSISRQMQIGPTLKIHPYLLRESVPL